MKITKHDKMVKSKDFKESTFSSVDLDFYANVAKENGINHMAYTARVRRGMHPQKAATLKLKKSPTYVWVGEWLDTRHGHCNAMDVSYNTVAGIMHRRGLDFESAILLHKLEQTKKSSSIE